MLKPAALLIVALGLLQDSGAVPAHVRAAADAISRDRIARDLAFLSSDALEGRATPSPGFDSAAEYLADRLGAAGLKPGGDNGTYFQHYTMREIALDTQASAIGVGGVRYAFGKDFITRTLAPTPRGSFPAVYVGHGWRVPAHGIDPYAGLDLKRKVVVAHGPRAMPKGVDITQRGRITPGASSVIDEAGSRGAVAVIYLPTEPIRDWDAIAASTQRRRELEPRVPSAYAAPPLTSLVLARPAAEALLAGEPQGEGLLALGDAGDYPASFQLQQPVTLDLAMATDIVHRPYNVVAILEGSDPDLKVEHITVFAHLDGAVGTREVDGDRIYNSADDNASGSAATLSIAEQMAAARPKRSIIFVWDSGEEVGLWGTRHFVANPPVPLDRIVAHFNIDMIGGTRAPGTPDAADERITGPNEVFVIGPGVLSERADALITRANDEYLKLTLNRADDRADSSFFYPRTDAGPFLERGVLTIGFTTGIHDRYHLPADEAGYLDPDKITAIAKTVFVSIWTLADAAERPGIDKPIPDSVPRYK